VISEVKVVFLQADTYWQKWVCKFGIGIGLNILLMLYISKNFNYPKLSTRDMTEETEGNGDDNLRCSSWITFCQSCLGLMEEEEAKLV